MLAFFQKMNIMYLKAMIGRSNSFSPIQRANGW